MAQKSKTDRIGKMIDIVKQLVKGDYSVHFELSSKNDELDVLASLMNKIVDNIRKRLFECKLTEVSREREEMWKLLFDNTDASVNYFDEKGIIKLINRKSCERLGWDSKEAVGRSIYDMFPIKVADFHMKRFLKIINEGKGEKFEDMFELPQGKKYFLSDIQPMRDLNGKIIGVQIISNDVTEHKQAEETLKKSEEQYRTLFESAEVGMYRSTLEGSKILAVNHKLSEILGITKEEILSNPAFIRWENPADRDEMVRKLREDGYMRNYEIRVKAAGDEIRTLLLSGDVMPEKGWFEGSIIDITEHNRAEEALRESEERFSLFMGYLPAVVFIKDEESRALYVNKYMNDVFGAKDWIGKTLLDLYPKDLAEAMIADDKKALAEGYRTIVETVPDKHGINHIYQTHKFKIERSGKPPLLGGIALDITEHERAEEQIKKELKEKEILLKEINHRVKNNMVIISSLLKLQSRKIRNKQALAALEESRNRIRTMALIHEKLYKSESLADVDFAVYIKDLSNNLFKSYNVSPETIKLKLNIGDVQLGVDQGIPCGLILNELISNALEHAFQDGRSGEIGIELKNENNYCRLTVWDNGIGIPETVDAEKTDSLGLHLVHILTEQIKGKLVIRRNKGTTFIIRFSLENR